MGTTGETSQRTPKSAPAKVWARRREETKRTATMIMTVALLMVALSGVALAATLTGTAGGHSLKGTSQADVLKGLGGDDLLQGFGGDDFLYGGTGSDKIYDGGGADWIVSEDDGKADTVDCGSGVDAVKASPTEQIDTYVGCERFVY